MLRDFEPKSIKELSDFSKTWESVNKKLLYLADIGVFSDLDTLRFGVDRVCSYRVSEDGKTLSVTLALFERGYGEAIEMFSCPAEVFLMDDTAVHLWVIERNKQLKQKQDAELAVRKKEERRKEYLKLKAEFEQEDNNE